jgi:hypothetical protein
MMQLMEPGTVLQQPTSLTLQNPERWSDTAQDFLNGTSSQPLFSLSEVQFLGFISCYGFNGIVGRVFA